MAKVTVITLVHNPGEYIYPCVDSVLNQTFDDFSYVIIDNASSDGTKEVLEEYAKKDARIQLYRNEENNVGSIKAIETYVSTEYYMVLDHDDYIEPEALELLYTAAIKENLDMVFGRCEMMDAHEKTLGEAGFQQELPCLNVNDLWKYFDSLYWQMRTQWGKLIRTSLIKYIDMDTMKRRQPSKYAGDTVMILSMAFAAERIGTVERVLHHYRILDKSDSKTYCRQRFLADWMVLDMARDLLRGQNGLTAQNDIFLLRVYLNAISDTLRMILRGEVAITEKMEAITEILVKEHTEEMFIVLSEYVPESAVAFANEFGHTIMSIYLKYWEQSECKKLMFHWLKLVCGKETLFEDEFSCLYRSYKAILLLFCLNRLEQAYHDMDQTECPKQCPELYLSLALRYEKDIKKMARILLELGSTRPELYRKAGDAVRILAEQNMILSRVEKDVLEENPEIVAAVCAEEYLLAANLCMEHLTQEQWQKSGGLLDIAISLAAILGDAEAFVMLKKCSCEFFLRENKIEEAKTVLTDLEEMCIGDEEVKALAEAVRGK